MLLFEYKILFTADFLLAPLLIVMWIGIAMLIRNRKYKGTVIYKYFVPALVARIVGAVLTALMYQYYYGGGDTFMYFFGAKDIFDALLGAPDAAYEMLFVDMSDWKLETFDHVKFVTFFSKEKEALVLKLGGVFSIVGFGTYIGISLGITFFSFLGCWCLFLVFYHIYPHLHRPFAYAFLFLPSMCFWSTGLMKDPLVIAGLGFFVYGIYFLLMKPNGKWIRNIILILLGVWLMKNIKVYVIASVFPATLIWFFLMFKDKIRNPTLRKIATPVFMIGGGGAAVLAVQMLGNSFAAFSLEGFLEESAKMQWWLTLSTDRDGGTGYTLNFEPTVMGLLKVFPEAVNVTLFRPYLWEARKVIVMPSALEALFSFGYTIYVVYKVGLGKILRYLITEPTVTFCFIFAFIFAFAVGFTSMNFGALARYKIPCLPFYFAGLIILHSKVKYPHLGSTTIAASNAPKEKPALV